MGAGARGAAHHAAQPGAGAAPRAQQAAGPNDAGERAGRGLRRRGAQGRHAPWADLQAQACAGRPSHPAARRRLLPAQALAEVLEDSEHRGTISSEQHRALMGDLSARLTPLLLHPA